MSNPYLDSLQSRALTPGDDAPANPYLQRLEEEAANRKARLAAQLSQAVKVNPEQYNTQRRVAQYLGYPVAAVETLPELADQAKVQQIQRDTARSPVLQRKYSEADFAKLAHDDSGTLAKLYDWSKGAGSQLLGSLHSGALSLVGVGATVIDALNPFTLSPSDAAVLFKDDPAKLRDVLQNSPATALSRVSRAMQEGSQAVAKDVNPQAQEAYGNLKYATLNPSEAAYLSPVKVTSDALQSLPTTLALAFSAYFTRGQSIKAYETAVAGGATAEAALATAVKTGSMTMARTSAASEGVVGAAQQFNQVEMETLQANLSKSPRYAELIAQGYSPEAAREVVAGSVATQAGQIAGIVDSVTNYVGGKYLGKIISEGGTLVPRVLKGAVQEGVTEFVQSMGEQFGQNWAEQMGIDPNTSLIKDVLESGIQGLVVGGLTGGGFAAAFGRVTRDQQQIAQSQADADRLQQALQAAGQSLLRERSPEQFRAVMAEMTDGNVYVDGQVLNQLAPEVLNQLPESVREKVATAAAIGDSVEIPVADVLTIAPGTPLEQVIVENARTSPDAPSLAEARAAGEKAQEFLQQEAERVIAQAQDQEALRQSQETVKQNIKQQLAATGRFRDAVNDGYATWAAAFYTAYGSRMGMTPEQFYQRYPLRVLGAPVGQQTGVLNEDEGTLRQAYADAPDNLMGFTKGKPSKAFGEQGYKHVQYVQVKFSDGTQIVDAITGLNASHAMERARRNWPTGEVTGISEEEAVAADPTIAEDVAAAMVEGKRKREATLEQRVEPLTENDADRAASLNAARVSPRMPTGVKATENGFGETRLQPTIAAMPESMVEKTAAEFLKYPNFAGLKGTPREILEQAKQHMKDNLRALVDAFPADLRERARMWYVGGNRIARALSEIYGVPPENVALAIAALSPQKNWFENVTGAERVIDIVVTKSEIPWSAEMTAVANARGWFLDKTISQHVKDVEGKTLRQMYDPADPDSFVRMAWWVRAYDEAHNPRELSVITPEGTFTDQLFSARADGAPTPLRWGSAGEIGKAIAALVARTPEARSKIAGGAHKVRSFFNNIIAPYAGEDVTIDTHAVAAALLRPLGGTTPEVQNVLSGGVSKEDAAKGYAGIGGSSITGSTGSYGVYADAYRELAAELNILPRELQSITWEAVRLLYDTKGATLKRDVADVWSRVSNGELTHEQAIKLIFELAGGIGRPDWSSAEARPQPLDSSYRRAPDQPAAGAAEGEGRQAAAGSLPGVLNQSGFDRFVGDATRVDLGDAHEFKAGEPRRVLEQTSRPFDQTQTEAFKRFSNDAPLVTSADATTRQFKTGEKVVVEAFHGTKRPDRVGTKFLKKRATSGPMAFHTSDPTLASSYATGKRDTSLSMEDQDYSNWFKVKLPGDRSATDLVRSWLRLTPEQKDRIAALAPRVMFGEEFSKETGQEIILGPEGHNSGTGSYDYNLAVTRTSWDRRGNPLKALVEDWLNSGNLFNDEERFMQVLKLAGFPMNLVEYDSPTSEFPFVYKNYIAMQKPLVTSDVPQEVVDALNAAAKRDRSRAKAGGADAWDKNLRTLKEWVAAFNSEDNKYVWTSIPDKVTEVFKSLGYDGIIDWSGKGGGPAALVAPVYIPFKETQVKSAIGNKGAFDTTKNDILKQGPRGTFNPQTLELVLNPNADLSTWFHETGHFFLEVLADVASQPDAPAQIAEDMNRVLAWFGIKGDETVGGADSGMPLAQSAQQTETPEFRRWFGDSKVIDKNGKPLVVYHGTPATFTAFDRKKSSSGLYGTGFYFTDNRDLAEDYAEGGNVMPVYLALRNPAPEDVADEVVDQVGEDDADGIRAELERRGYDGVMMRDGSEILVVAFQPEQIKSAISNDGTFDANDPNILSQGDQPAAPSTQPLPQRRTPLEVWNAMTLDQKRPYHERWAESIEQYVMEGKAPSVELQGVMRRFATWLKSVYGSIKQFLAARGVGQGAAGGEVLGQGAAAAQPDLFPGEFATKRTTVETSQVIDSKGTRAKGGNTNSKGQQVTATKQGLRRFWDWFAGSEATDDKGRPLVLYHSTNSDITQFETNRETTNSYGILGEMTVRRAGIFLTPDLKFSQEYLRGGAGQNVMQVYAALKSPLDLRAGLTVADEQALEAAGVSVRYVRNVQNYWELFDSADDGTNDFVDGLKAAGYDGAIFREDSPSGESEGGTTYVAFESNQVKSATGNRGTFDANDPSILSQGNQQQPINLQLNDDIRRVMDRMLATDEQIAQANEVAGLMPDEQADGEAAERLQKRSMRDLALSVKARDAKIKALRKEAKAWEKAIRAEVQAEVEKDPIYLAMRWLKKGEMTHPETGEEIKVTAGHRFDTQALAEMYPESMLNRPDLAGLRGMTSSTKGMHPHLIADMIPGWEGDGDQLVRAILAAEPMADVVDAMTERRMLEEHGDLIDERAITEAANEAVHNEARARSLATELRTQREMLGARTDTGEVNARGARITVNALVEAAKQFGANVISRTPLKDLRSTAWKHTAAERRAGKRWAEATAAGKTEDAVKAKQDQMLNNAAAKSALDAAAEAKKILEFFKRVTKGNDEKVVKKGRDPDIVNAARAVLAAYGIETPTTKGAQDYLDVLQRNDPDTYAVVQPMMAIAMQNAQPLEALTFEELQGLHESIQAMWHLAKRSRQMEVDGDLLDIDEVADEIFARMEQIGIPDRVAGEGMAVTKEEERGLFLKQGIAFLRRVEQWAEGMDGKYGGPFLRFIFQPIKDAADRYRKDRIAYRKKFQALVDNLAPIVGDSVIAAPELNYTFGTPGSTAGTAMNEILHAIAHTGNDSNKRKLLLGRGWATENPDGTLDTRRWDQFIRRLVNEGKLQKEHFDFVQGVWDLLEETKGDSESGAQKAHRDAFGRFFSEVTANEFVDPFGVTRRGGYVPAQVDSRLVKDNALRKLAEEQNNSMAYAFPQPAKGFTMARTEYNRPLMLDLRSLSQHLDKVLLFSHMTVPARDVRKLLTRKTVSQPLDRIQPAAIESMLQPWLQRSAQQVVEDPIVGSGKWARVPGIIRARAGAALMFANVSNAIQQVTGLSTAMVKVGPGHMMRALAQHVAHPVEAARAVWALSPYMDDRAKNEVAVMNEQMQAVLVNPSVYEKVQDWSMRHAYFLQTAIDNALSPIIWTGAYNQALAEGMSDVDAVRFADGTVRQTQGSTLPEDVSRFETGPAYARAFTQFVGYFNMVANTNATALKQIAGEVGLKKGAGRAFSVVMLGLLVPIWVAEAIALAFKGGPDDEDKDGVLIDDWLASVFGFGTAKGLLAMIPILGQAANSAVTRLDNNPMNDRISLSPGVSLLESALGGNVQTVHELLSEDKEVNARRAVRDAATLVSVFTGVPVYAVARPAGYAAGVAQGKIEPTSEVDMARGLITGTASTESKVR